MENIKWKMWLKDIFEQWKYGSFCGGGVCVCGGVGGGGGMS